MITHSETIKSLMAAMLKVQGAVSGVAKDSKNPHFKNSYASLEAVVDAIRPACQKNGLVVMQAPGEYASGVQTVETMIAHSESGEWIKSAVMLPVAKQDPQGAGSAITYGERYSLMALFNLPPVDDDGEAASRRPEPQVVTKLPSESERLADGLIMTINSAQNEGDLDDIRNDAEFKQKLNSLPLADKARVIGHGKRKADAFAGLVA